MSIFDLDKYGVTNRSILEDTFEDETKNIIEKEALKKYKETVKLIETERQKLNEIKKQIESLSSSNTIEMLNTEELNKLNNEHIRITKQIESNEKSLSWLENKFLQDVIERRKSELYRKFAGLSFEANLRNAEQSEEKAKIEQSSPSPETQATTPSTNKKKKGTIIEKNLGWILLIVFTIITIITMILSTREDWIYRLATAPFILFGNWVIIAGGFKIVETFENHISKTWQQVLLFTVSIFSVVVFFIYIN